MTQSQIGFIFPGQGSQFIGMLGDIAKEYKKEIHETFDEAAAVLNYDLWQLTQVGPTEELNKTIHTQPALLAASVALWKILAARKQIDLQIMAGHSLGEYSALVCADSLTFADGIRLVAARGEYMQAAVPVGAGGLAAIVGLTDEIVKEICQLSKDQYEVLAPANFNSIGQVVIAGHLKAVERALVLAKERGAKIAKLLPVSVPSHCELMKPAADKLAVILQSLKINKPKFSILNNVDVAIYQTDDEIRNGLVRQLFSPVRWVETMQVFAKQPITQVLECGPGKVLTGLAKRLLPNAQAATIGDVDSLNLFLASPVS